MYLSFFEEKPFYHELDFKFHYIEKYLYSLLENRNQSYFENKNKDQNYDLKSIYNLQNIIIAGPPGSCKTTQIHAFLATILNTHSIYNLKNNVEGFRYKYSPFHIQFSIKNFKNNDIIDDNHNVKFIRNIVSTPNLGFHIPKLLYITDFDKASMEIQKFFLRIIETSSSNVRFILEISNINNLNSALLSRFFTLYCKIPSYEEIKVALHNIYDKYILHNHSNMIHNHSENIHLLTNEKNKVIESIILNSHINNFLSTQTKNLFV
jgi:DNA polymerase III delta prime subunit